MRIRTFPGIRQSKWPISLRIIAIAPLNTKDLLDSRSIVHHSPKRDLLGRGSFVSACPDHSAYTRSCVRPMPGYPQRGSGGEGMGEGKRPRAWCPGLLCSVCGGMMRRGALGIKNGSALHVMLALRHSSREVVVADKQLDSTDMMSELFGKRQRVADQP